MNLNTVQKRDLESSSLDAKGVGVWPGDATSLA